MILSAPFYSYHFVRTIVSVPFCPMTFCPYTILSVPFVRYHFVLEPSGEMSGEENVSGVRGKCPEGFTDTVMEWRKRNLVTLRGIGTVNKDNK